MQARYIGNDAAACEIENMEKKQEVRLADFIAQAQKFLEKHPEAWIAIKVDGDILPAIEVDDGFDYAGADAPLILRTELS